MVRISGLTFYRQDCDVLEEFKKHHPDSDSTTLKQLLSQRWKTLSKQEKAKYLEKAREAKQESLSPQEELECEEIPPPYLPHSTIEDKIRDLQRGITLLREQVIMS